MEKSFNSLWPSNAVWWHSSGSTMVQVMACCLTAPNLYLNQCYSNVLWQVPTLLFCIMSWKIKLLNLLPHLPVVNGLNLESDIQGPEKSQELYHFALKSMISCWECLILHQVMTSVSQVYIFKWAAVACQWWREGTRIVDPAKAAQWHALVLVIFLMAIMFIPGFFCCCGSLLSNHCWQKDGQCFKGTVFRGN